VITGFNDEANHENNYAYSLYYAKDIKNFGYSLGVGYLTDLKTNNTSTTTLNSNLIRSSRFHNVGDLGAIWDFNGSVRYQQFTVSGEYNL
ncbi:hypothetical protein ABTL37_19515, partial [Acinetobacter baumannii]